MPYTTVNVRKHDRKHPTKPNTTISVRRHERRVCFCDPGEMNRSMVMAGKPPAESSDESPYPIKYKPMEYEILDWDEVEYGDEEDRKRIEDMAARDPDPGTIRIIASGGVVDDILNLPLGWDWEILDHDEQHEEGEALEDYKRRAASKPDPYTVRVVMSGGVVEEVQNLPKSGWMRGKRISTGVQDLRKAKRSSKIPRKSEIMKKKEYTPDQLYELGKKHGRANKEPPRDQSDWSRDQFEAYDAGYDLGHFKWLTKNKSRANRK